VIRAGQRGLQPISKIGLQVVSRMTRSRPKPAWYPTSAV
jgi:hypothetical protein